MSEHLLEQTLLQKAKRFFEPLRENKLYTFTVFLEFSFWSALWLIAVFFIRDITSILESGVRHDYSFVIFRYIIIFSCLMLASHFIKNYWWVRFLENLRKSLYKKYIPLFISLDNTKVERQWTWKVNHLLQQWINAHSLMLNDTLYNSAKILPFLVFTLYFVFKIYFLLWIAFIFLYIGLTLFTKYFDYKQVQIRRKKHILKKENSRSVAKIIMSKYEILQSSKVDFEVQKISDTYDAIVENNREQNYWGHILFRGSEVILFSSKIILLVFIGQQYFDWEISLTYVVTFITVLTYFEKNAQDFLIFYKNFTRDIHEMTGLWDFFDSTPQIVGYEEGNTFEHTKWKIQIENLSFGYDEENLVFKDFSLKILWEKVTAFVGPSWWGKSTLVKLIAGYIRASSWEIMVDGQKLSETSLKSYYKDIWYLTQEPSVFDGSVRENLLYGLSTHTTPLSNSLLQGERTDSKENNKNVASFSSEEKEFKIEVSWGEEVEEKKLKDIIELAQCQFIYELPEGLDTQIGERWVKLSGGQKQRLAIAKIFLKNPKIIILDEPTSALDSISEKKITQAMHNLFQERTVLVIAHRLQTVKHADDIVVIQNWQLLERWTHKELVKQKWFYKEMLDLQSWF